MTLKEIFNKFTNKHERFKDMQREDRMERILEERKKNANERELERFIEEDRQKRIKIALDEYRKKRKDEFFHGENMLKQKNIFKGHKSILHQDFDILKGGKKLFMKKGGML